MAIEVVSFPIDGGLTHSCHSYVSHYQRITDVFISGPLRFVAGMVEGAKGHHLWVLQNAVCVGKHWGSIAYSGGNPWQSQMAFWHLIGLASLNLIITWAVQLGRYM